MPDTIGVALVGLDHWYSAFMVLEEVAAEESMRLVAIAEEDAERLEQARSKHHPEAAVTDWRQAVEDPRVDLVFSFVDTASNPAVCLEALGRGKHVLCVKPCALTLEDANRLAAAAQDSGVIFSSFEVSHRTTAKSRFLKQLIADGSIGQPVTFYHVAHGGLPRPWPDATGHSWWLDPSRVPGGAWIDHAIYAVDQARWILDQEVVSVSAAMATRRHTHLALEDWGVAWLTLSGGAAAVLEDTWTADSGTRFDRWIGTGGSIEPAGDAFLVHAGGRTERIPIEEEGPSTMAQIAAAAAGRVRLPFTPTCCVHNLAACLAAYESARTGRHASPSG